MKLETCFTPALYPYISISENFIVVVIDVLRATTSICTAFDYGVRAIIPAAGVEDARRYKNEGYIVAAEREGIKLDFADFGNSAFNFMNPDLKGTTIAYSTTNGVQAIETAKNADSIAICAFTNLNALANWLLKQEKNVVILCSGWKNKFNLEDSVCAGALAELLLISQEFTSRCDSTQAALDFWQSAKPDLPGYLKRAAHEIRLKKLGLDDVIPFSYQLNTSNAVPVWNGKEIVNRQTAD